MGSSVCSVLLRTQGPKVRYGWWAISDLLLLLVVVVVVVVACSSKN